MRRIICLLTILALSLSMFGYDVNTSSRKDDYDITQQKTIRKSEK